MNQYVYWAWLTGRSGYDQAGWIVAVVAITMIMNGIMNIVDRRRKKNASNRPR